MTTFVTFANQALNLTTIARITLEHSPKTSTYDVCLYPKHDDSIAYCESYDTSERAHARMQDLLIVANKIVSPFAYPVEYKP